MTATTQTMHRINPARALAAPPAPPLPLGIRLGAVLALLAGLSALWFDLRCDALFGR